MDWVKRVGELKRMAVDAFENCPVCAGDYDEPDRFIDDMADGIGDSQRLDDIERRIVRDEIIRMVLSE